MRAVTAGVGLMLAILLALGGAGCTSSLFESELPTTTAYVIAPAPAATATGPVMPVDVSIGRPDMAPGLDTERIAVLKGRQLDYYRAARWGSNTIELLQTLLVDSLEDQRLFRSVTAEQARVSGDYVLDVEVRDFQAEYAAENAAPTAHVTIVGRLIRVVDRELVATVLAESHGKAQDNRLGAVIAAFEAAAHEVALDLARKTAVSVADDAQKLRSAQDTGEVATP